MRIQKFQFAQLFEENFQIFTPKLITLEPANMTDIDPVIIVCLEAFKYEHNNIYVVSLSARCILEITITIQLFHLPPFLRDFIVVIIFGRVAYGEAIKKKIH